jgi:RNA polymerase sigma factor (sigma-70 family)
MSDSGLLRLVRGDGAEPAAPVVAPTRPRPRSDSGIRSRDAATMLAFAAIDGDGEALEALLRELAPGILGTVRAVMGISHPDRDDVLQECLIALVDALPAFEGRSTIARYATRIAIRLCLERRRRAQRRHAKMALDGEIDEVAVDGDDPEAGRRREAVRRLLDQLPEAQAETLALRICLGMSLEEVSEVTGAPVNTVRSRVRLARESLRARIEQDPSLVDLLGSPR